VYGSLKDKSVLYSDLAYSDNGVDVDSAFEKLSSSQKELVTSVLDTLSKWTGMELEAATHREKPWLEARRGCSEADKRSVEISKAMTALFYRQEQNVGKIP